MLSLSERDTWSITRHWAQVGPRTLPQSYSAVFIFQCSDSSDALILPLFQFLTLIWCLLSTCHFPWDCLWRIFFSKVAPCQSSLCSHTSAEKAEHSCYLGPVIKAFIAHLMHAYDQIRDFESSLFDSDGLLECAVSILPHLCIFLTLHSLNYSSFYYKLCHM